MSTDAENARVWIFDATCYIPAPKTVVDAAERIEAIIKHRDHDTAVTVEGIRTATERFTCDDCGTLHGSVSALMYCCLEKDQG